MSRAALLALRRAAVFVCVAAVLLVACGQENGENESPPDREAGPGVSRDGVTKPNVVLILADDLDRSVFERSGLDEAWSPEGVDFTNALATTSLCCPSRASILRGQYAHNTKLVNNDNAEPGGGGKFFRGSGLEDETLATLLQEGGYETWFGGKYLNGYEAAGGADGHVPPGWDGWQAYLGPLHANVDGETSAVEGHYTDWLAARAEAFIEEGRDPSRPFFMQISAWDVHEPRFVPPRHVGAYPDARAPRPPSFGEADVSDKPAWVRGGRPIRPGLMEAYDRRQAERLRSALTLEDLSRDVVGALERAGQLGNTYLVFTSDNGYHMGLHGIGGASKFTPYTEAHEVPFVVRGPGVRAGASERLVANIDIAPTVLDLGGIGTPGWMDGRSIASLLDGTVPGSWRDSLLIEGVKSGSPKRPGYSGVRREDEVYVEYDNGEKEYYDLAEDPYQLESRPENAPASMREQLEVLEDCSGSGCGRAEGP